MHGATPTAHQMGFDAFLTLAKECGALSKALTRTELQLIFVRSNINRVDDDTSNDRPDSLLELPEFVGAVSRMAAEKLPKLAERGGMCLAAMTDAFITGFLQPQVLALMSGGGFNASLGEFSLKHVNAWGYARLDANASRLRVEFVRTNRHKDPSGKEVPPGQVWDSVELLPWV